MRKACLIVRLNNIELKNRLLTINSNFPDASYFIIIFQDITKNAMTNDRVYWKSLYPGRLWRQTYFKWSYLFIYLWAVVLPTTNTTNRTIFQLPVTSMICKYGLNLNFAVCLMTDSGDNLTKENRWILWLKQYISQVAVYGVYRYLLNTKRCY